MRKTHSIYCGRCHKPLVMHAPMSLPKDWEGVFTVRTKGGNHAHFCGEDCYKAHCGTSSRSHMVVQCKAGLY